MLVTQCHTSLMVTFNFWSFSEYSIWYWFQPGVLTLVISCNPIIQVLDWVSRGFLWRDTSNSPLSLSFLCSFPSALSRNSISKIHKLGFDEPAFLWRVFDDKGQYSILLVPRTSEVHEARKRALQQISLARWDQSDQFWKLSQDTERHTNDIQTHLQDGLKREKRVVEFMRHKMSIPSLLFKNGSPNN